MNQSAPKRLAIIGATGSIGRQTLDILDRFPGLYHASVLSAGSKVEELAALAIRHRPRLAVIGRPELEGRLRELVGPYGISTASGPEALAAAAEADDVDMVVTATVGYSGLEPTVRAIRAGKEIALANKETLVVAGEYIRRLLAVHPEVRIFPIDSEHSAVAQCLAGESPENVRRLIITASGGPFRTWEAGKIEKATAADALRHPNWSMGAKITVDSATMLNKAFEIIEARWLFDIPAERIAAVVHPQSIVHSMVEFRDGAIKAQLGVPDMRLPIAYALGRSSRLAGVSEPLTLEKISTLTFEAPDERKFPCLGFARYCLERMGTSACTVNGANEVAVAAFLRGGIAFGDIYRTIAHALEHATFVASPGFDDYVASNAESRRIAEEFVSKIRLN